MGSELVMAAQARLVTGKMLISSTRWKCLLRSRWLCQGLVALLPTGSSLWSVPCYSLFRLLWAVSLMIRNVQSSALQGHSWDSAPKKRVRVMGNLMGRQAVCVPTGMCVATLFEVTKTGRRASPVRKY